MRSIIVDTSVVIKWYFDIEEQELEKANLVYNLISEGEVLLVEPEIVLLEIANSAKFSKHASESECQRIISSFKEICEKLVELPKISSIVENMYAGQIQSYDAVFVALANQLNFPLITADYKHHKKDSSKNIIWLKEWKGNF